MRRKPDLMQLEIGMSTSRYLPASGTAGLARSFVSGNRRVPCPPPMMTQRTLLVLVVWRVRDIKIPFVELFEKDLTPIAVTMQATDSFLRNNFWRCDFWRAKMK